MDNIKPKVLLVAYACRPNTGTEYGVGWNFFKELSSLVDLHLITEAGYESEIIYQANIFGYDTKKITFINIGEKARKLCDNQGSWSFYFHYRKWQIEAADLAVKLNNVHDFDIIHHLNMIGFREPGFMYRVGKPFVIGPLGGFGGIKFSFLQTLGVKSFCIEMTKKILNFVNMFLPRIRRSIRSAEAIISAVPEAQSAIKNYFFKISTVVPETGCLPFSSGAFARRDLLWVGKEVDRKMFHIACVAFVESELSKTEKLYVIGSFSSDTKRKWAADNIIFMDSLPHNKVVEFMGKCRALLFPSVHEGNPHVVFEAISRATPVICHDSYGMGYAINDKIGFKIPMISPEKSIVGFKNAINKLTTVEFMENDFREFCIDNSWKSRAEIIFQTYLTLLK